MDGFCDRGVGKFWKLFIYLGLGVWIRLWITWDVLSLHASGCHFFACAKK